MYQKGDVTDVLRTLADESVQCVITSPPYWGLRDYGTAQWKGGDPKCKHVAATIRTGLGLAVLGERFRGGGHKQGEVTELQYRDVCAKCGAVRVDQQIGLEKTPEEYIAKMVKVFREVRRVLRADGTCWVNLGDSYASGKGTCYNPGGGANSLGQGRKAEGAHPLDRGNKSTLAAVGLKPKDLVGIPWMLAFALRSDGWHLRQDIIWAKPNPMPESVTDRCTKSHEYLFMLSKNAHYFYDAEAIKEPGVMKPQVRLTPRDFVNGKDAERRVDRRPNYRLREDVEVENAMRNKRSVWTIATQPFKEAHFATYPEKLVEPCILAGSAVGDTVLDPFVGSGTTGVVALRYSRNFIGIELNPEYAVMARQRIKNDAPLFNTAADSEEALIGTV